MPLTIVNHTGITVTLKPLCRVAQLVLFSMTDHPRRLYKDIEDSKYYKELVDPSKLHLDKELLKMMDQIIKEETPSLYKLMEDTSL